MSSTPVKRIVVCGGNGFLGSRICKAAVTRGWEVTSVSRSGQPKWDAVTASANPPPWAHKVSWERADILKPSTYAPFLKGADYVVHSMGILLEADYKGVVSGQESPISGLRRAFSATKAGAINPLARQSSSEPLESGEKDGQLTYELMNRDSAIVLAQEASKESVPAFCFISAAGGAPVLPQRYITTKRQAEDTIASQFPRMRSFFVRPGMLWDSSRAVTVPMAGATALGAAFNSVTMGVLGNFLGAAGVMPIKADEVAEAVVEGLSDDNVKGPVELKEIHELASTSWRKGML